MAVPFLLLDDARTDGPSPARLYQAPVETVVARHVADVVPALDRIETLRAAGHHIAGYLAYEAGLALEGRLAPLAAARTGGCGPLLWFGAFAGYDEIAAAEVPGWLAAQATGSASVGPLDPQISPGGYSRAFAAMEEAIAAGDIYQANLTFPLAGSYRGDPLALYAALRPAAGAGYGGVVFDGSHWLLSLSPELFFALKDGAARVKPMKGTRPRGRDPAEDAAMRDELAHVLARPWPARWATPASEVLALFDRYTTPCPAPALGAGDLLHCSDPDDQKFIDLALALAPACLVSRDRALLKLTRRAAPRGVRVLSPERWGGFADTVTQSDAP